MTAAATNVAPTARLYTQLPYPGDGVVRMTVANMLHGGLRRHAPHILDAPVFYHADIGCGTGEVTCGIALKFRNARVIGADVNPPSLELARKLSDERHANIKFVWANITDGLWKNVQAAGVLPPGEKLDTASSMGVLHCLDRPADGFAAIREMIKPTGLFICYMYSTYGRWDVSVVKSLMERALPANVSFEQRADVLRKLHLTRRVGAMAFLRSLRKRMRVGPAVSPLELLRVRMKRRQLIHASDIYSCPKEFFMTFGELSKIFDETGWKFVGMAEKSGIPTCPEEHTSDPAELAVLRSLPQDVLFDYFAFQYSAGGFTFFLRPA